MFIESVLFLLKYAEFHEYMCLAINVDAFVPPGTVKGMGKLLDEWYGTIFLS